MRRFRPLPAGAACFLLGLLWATTAAAANGVWPTPGKVVAWGHNGSNQTDVPAGLSDVKAIAAGVAHSVALKSDGTVVAWGFNNKGQSNVPAGLNGVVAIGAGEWYSVALKSDGTVVEWGQTYTSSLHTNTPPGLSGVIAIASGAGHIVALKNDGTLAGWGDGGGGADIPAGLTGVVSIAAGDDHSLALKSDGTVAGWGFNFYGQATVPAGLNGVVAIAAGANHSLALKSNGTVVAWGRTQFAPTNVPAGLNGVTAIAGGGWEPMNLVSAFSLALKSDGTVAGWGDNASGQLTPPAGIGAIKAIAAGGQHTLAIVPDATPPVITSILTGTVLNNGWYINNVDVSWTVTDPESTVSSKSGCDASTVNTDTTGLTLTCTATSGGGSSSKPVTIKRDATNPNASCGSPDGLWHASDVSIACTSSDATSGLASAADASFNLSTSVASGTETANASTGSRTILDNAGNSSSAGPVSGIKVDKKGPAITITAPAGPYLLNQAVAASYSCSDGGSGVASCSGTVADGANLNTATAGAKTFTVNAKDNVNNASTASVTYSVGYVFSGFGPPVVNPPGVNSGNGGSTIPLKWQLRDGNGNAISALAAIAALTYKATSCAAFTSDPAGAAPLSSGSGLSYRAPLFQYDWKTPKGAGCYTVFLSLNSGQVFPAYFSLK